MTRRAEASAPRRRPTPRDRGCTSRGDSRPARAAPFETRRGLPMYPVSTTSAPARPARATAALLSFAAALLATLFSTPAWAQPHPAGQPGGEADLIVPDLSTVNFFGTDGHTLLLGGILVSLLGMGFGLAMYMQLRNAPVHKSMLEVSELIYETCKTYLVTQLKFLLILEAFIGVTIVVYFGVIQHQEPLRVFVILLMSMIGIAGSCLVAWFGIRVNTFANSRTAFAALKGKPFPCYSLPLKAGMSIGMLLISVELILMLGILLFIPGSWAGPCFIGFAIGESLGASALRIAGGIFTKIADIGSGPTKIAFQIQEND